MVKLTQSALWGRCTRQGISRRVAQKAISVTAGSHVRAVAKTWFNGPIETHNCEVWQSLSLVSAYLFAVEAAKA
jgi:hypothetical protein